MRHNRLMAVMLMAAAAATVSAENLISDPYLESEPLYGCENTGRPGRWTHSVKRPAAGEICRRMTPESDDSVMYARIKYLSESDDPFATSFSQGITMVAAKKYRFTAMVKFLTPDACLTLAARLGSTGRTVASLTLESGKDGRFVPGVWTKAVLDFDLSGVTDAGELTSLAVYMMPQTDSNLKCVVSQRHAAMMIGGTELRTLEGAGQVNAVTDGSFTLWDGAVAQPRHWSVSGAVAKSAGVYTFDYAPCAGAASSLTSDNVDLGGSRRNSLSFYVNTPSDGTVAVSSERLGTVASLSVKASSGWKRLSAALDYEDEATGDRLTFALPEGARIDGVSVEPVYGIDNPRPAERTLHVTSSADDGAGSLRACVAEALPGDMIVFDVDAVTLTDVINLSDKTISIDGRGATLTVASPGESRHRIFEITPKADGSMLMISDLKLVGGSQSNGAIIYISDSRADGRLNVVFDRVTFTGGKSSAAGGAVNATAPNTRLLFSGCRFEGCSASTQGGALSLSVSAELNGCRFENNTSATGAAVAVPGGPGVAINNSLFINNTATGARGGAFSFSSTTATEPVELMSCSFVGNRSTHASTGAGAVVINGMNSGAVMTNLTFYNNEGKSASGIEFYNSARTVQHPSYVINSTFVGGGDVPDVRINATKTTIAPDVTLVNDLFYGKSDGRIALNGGSFIGSNNLFGAAQSAGSLTSSIICDDILSEIFARYDGGFPQLGDDHTLVLAASSPAAGAGLASYRRDGVELVPAIDACGNPRPAAPSVGARETTENDGVGDITVVPGDDIRLSVYPNPATTVVNVASVRPITRVSLVSLGGATVMTSNTTQLDVSWLPRGLYIVTAEAEDGTSASTRLIIR